jgi:uncharacterized repeat protein (TIGR03847 family)
MNLLIGLPLALWVFRENVLFFYKSALLRIQTAWPSKRVKLLPCLDELSVAGQVGFHEMEYPITEDFRVGIVGISWNRELQRVEVEIQAVSEEAVEDLISGNSSLDDQELPDLITASLRIYQIRSFCTQSDLLVSAGRQPCPFCGLPIDLDGHLCPRSNGYRR